MAKRVKKQEQEVVERAKEKQDDSRATQCWYGMAFILPVPIMLGAGAAGGVVVDHGGACGNVCIYSALGDTHSNFLRLFLGKWYLQRRWVQCKWMWW
jgi:hypothetical protein